MLLKNSYKHLTFFAYVIVVSLLLAGAISAGPFKSGDILSGEVLVRYSGEDVQWTACAADINPGNYAEFLITDLVTGQVVRSGSTPLVNGRFVFTVDIPRTGFYSGQIRSCNQTGCSEWYYSSDTSSQPSCTTGSNYVYSILAPAGPVILE